MSIAALAFYCLIDAPARLVAGVAAALSKIALLILCVFVAVQLYEWVIGKRGTDRWRNASKARKLGVGAVCAGIGIYVGAVGAMAIYRFGFLAIRLGD